MPSHVVLLVVIISAKNGQSCLYGQAKYNLTKEGTLDTRNPNHEFDATGVSPCIPHCMFSVVVNRKPKQLEEFIHFGIECNEYNPVTGNSGVNMQITVLYHAEFVRFKKYLGHLGSNIKIGSMYLVLGLFKFSMSGKMMIEATDIDYLKTSNANYNTYENFFLFTPSTRSIINVIADDVETITTQTPKTVKSMIASADRDTISSDPSKNMANITVPVVPISSSGPSKNLAIPIVQIDPPCENKKQKQLVVYVDLNDQDKKPSDYKDIDSDEVEEESQTKKKKKKC
ncbi:1301_t:CDS:2 [Gigaspora margarita]|uniref:1301_t:CDS:1 n=1 Tax=Gigaspora margarita TaxID=4874 RepID=A0ABN7UYD9_GIGMA|nr:1301_t:CDS:2 [Gigaspora margarita]